MQINLDVAFRAKDEVTLLGDQPLSIQLAQAAQRNELDDGLSGIVQSACDICLRLGYKPKPKENLWTVASWAKTIKHLKPGDQVEFETLAFLSLTLNNSDSLMIFG